MNFRSRILKAVYRAFPFPLIGDLSSATSGPTCDVSCIINFYGRIDLLEGILHSLAEQDLLRTNFEVILVEDRGGTEQGRAVSEQFEKMLNVRYFALPEHYGFIGYARNYALSRAAGKYVLILDDDTVILQKDFLSKLVQIFSTTQTDGVIPRGSASFCLVKGQYDYHDPFFPTNRCMAYRRDVLQELGGFVSAMIGQEDVEFFVRYLAAGKRSMTSAELAYYHPPVLYRDFRKPMAVGSSFYRLRSRYPILPWLMMIANCGRHAPLYLCPQRRYREMGRFGLGFLAGVIASPFKKDEYTYR